MHDFDCKMDADFIEKRKRYLSTKRAARASMDPQRFGEILAEIRRALSNIHATFETVNIGSLLEEACLQFAEEALESAKPPNFTEASTVLQECAQLYGRKVDNLHEDVYKIFRALVSKERRADEAERTPTAARRAAKRRRRVSSDEEELEFEHLELQESASATLPPGPLRVPPTLPRLYIDLEPRVPSQYDATLRDYGGESLGLPADFHVTGRLQDGFLTDDLSAWNGASAGALQPLSLEELHAALVAGVAGPSSPPRDWTPPPLGASTPLPPEEPEEPQTPEAPEPASEPSRSRQRRRRDAALEYVDPDSIRLRIDAALEEWLDEPREFSLEPEWRRRVVDRRTRRILEVRAATAPERDFRGFEDAYPDPGGFLGWSAQEAREAAAAAARLLAERAALGSSLCDADSDDDGYFERSSFSSNDYSHADCFACPAPPPRANRPADRPVDRPADPADPDAADMEAWYASATAAAAAAEARGPFDPHAQGAAVLEALPEHGAVHVTELLSRTAPTQYDVSRVLLSTLFLANTGNVRIERGAPGSINSFSVRLVSKDQSALQEAAAAAFANM